MKKQIIVSFVAVFGIPIIQKLLIEGHSITIVTINEQQTNTLQEQLPSYCKNKKIAEPCLYQLDSQLALNRFSLRVEAGIDAAILLTPMPWSRNDAKHLDKARVDYQFRIEFLQQLLDHLLPKMTPLANIILPTVPEGIKLEGSEKILMQQRDEVIADLVQKPRFKKSLLNLVTIEVKRRGGNIRYRNQVVDRFISAIHD